MTDTTMIEKIKKLLRLSENEGATEHEARLAAERASELMLRHKLSMQQVAGHEEKDGEDVIGETVEQKTTRQQDRFIYSLLQKFFFVQTVRSKYYGSVTWHIMGRESDVEIALYMREFFFRKFPELFKLFKRQTAAAEGDRGSYYVGLYDGLYEQLHAKQAKVETEMALVVVDDKAVSTFVEKAFPKLKSMKGTVNLRSAAAEAAGRTAGKNMSLNRGVSGAGTKNLQLT